MAVVAITSRTIGEELIELGWRMSSVLCDLVHRCADFEDSEEWSASGSSTAANWISEALEVDVRTVREWLRVGRKLRSLPLIDGAFRSGRLSYSKVRALCPIAEPKNEKELLPIAEATSAEKLRSALNEWSSKNEDPKKRRDRHKKNRGLWPRTEVDGMGIGVLQLPSLEMGTLMAAVDACVRRRAQKRRDASVDASDMKWPSYAQQRVDALMELVTEGGAKVETEVILHVRGDGSTLDDGTPIDGSLVERIAPQSFIRALIHDANGKPINASGRHRHPTARQKRVVHERDGGVCRNCGGTEFLEYDHVPDFDESQQTVVDELELRCAQCHHWRHGKERR